MTNTPALSLLTLLSMFSSFSDAELREQSPSLAIERVIEVLPLEQSAYEAIVVELAAAPLDSEQAIDRFERAAAILRLLLYKDGRSELALYRVVDTAIAQEAQETEALAVNALAALANYYYSGGKSAATPQLLQERLAKYAEIEPLFNNAMACRRNLLHRAGRR